MGLAALLQPIAAPTNWLFISQGRSKAFAWSGAFNAAISTVAFCAGLPWGPIGVAAAYSISQLYCGRRSCGGWRHEPVPVRLRDLYGARDMHALASAGSFTSIVVARQAITLDGIPALALFLCLSYAITIAGAGADAIRPASASGDSVRCDDHCVRDRRRARSERARDWCSGELSACGSAKHVGRRTFHSQGLKARAT